MSFRLPTSSRPVCPSPSPQLRLRFPPSLPQTQLSVRQQHSHQPPSVTSTTASKDRRRYKPPSWKPTASPPPPPRPEIRPGSASKSAATARTSARCTTCGRTSTSSVPKATKISSRGSPRSASGEDRPGSRVPTNGSRAGWKTLSRA